MAQCTRVSYPFAGINHINNTTTAPEPNCSGVCINFRSARKKIITEKCNKVIKQILADISDNNLKFSYFISEEQILYDLRGVDKIDNLVETYTDALMKLGLRMFNVCHIFDNTSDDVLACKFYVTSSE
jgi:hypothetical protein